jgi:hypothetical protein
MNEIEKEFFNRVDSIVSKVDDNHEKAESV